MLWDEALEGAAFDPMPEKLRRFHGGKGLRIKNSRTAHHRLLLSFSFSFSCEIHIFIL